MQHPASAAALLKESMKQLRTFAMSQYLLMVSLKLLPGGDKLPAGEGARL
jgi:hypothetical protein